MKFNLAIDLSLAIDLYAADMRSQGRLTSDSSEREADERIATLAGILALRRHGRDLREARLLIGSGGVLRHASPEAAGRILGAVLTDHAGGWPLPRAATAVVDRDYVLAAAGLLAAEHPAAAVGLLRQRLPTVPSISH